jgi:hypothetical protein
MGKLKLWEEAMTLSIKRYVLELMLELDLKLYN